VEEGSGFSFGSLTVGPRHALENTEQRFFVRGGLLVLGALSEFCKAELDAAFVLRLMMHFKRIVADEFADAVVGDAEVDGNVMDA
jgi:hypothetical protein